MQLHRNSSPWQIFDPSAEEVALDRWDVAVYYAVEPSAVGKTNAKHGAFLSNQEPMKLMATVVNMFFSTSLGGKGTA